MTPYKTPYKMKFPCNRKSAIVNRSQRPRFAKQRSWKLCTWQRNNTELKRKEVKVDVCTVSEVLHSVFHKCSCWPWRGENTTAANLFPKRGTFPRKRNEIRPPHINRHIRWRDFPRVSNHDWLTSGRAWCQFRFHGHDHRSIYDTIRAPSE